MRNRLIRASWVALATAAALLGLPAASGAAPTWLAASSLSQPGQAAEYADAAMGAGGGAAVSWMRSDGTYLRAQAAVRQPFGSFGAALTLSPEKQDALYPQVAEDATGDATVVWENATSSPVVVEAATIADGLPSMPVAVSDAPGGAVFPAVAVDERGDAIVAWMAQKGSEAVIEAALRPAGGSFGAPVVLSEAGHEDLFPRVAIDAAGDAIVVWYGNKAQVEYAAYQAGVGFTTARALSEAGEPAEYPQVAMDAAGATVVGWQRSDGTHEIAQAALRAAGAATFGPVANLSAPGGSVLYVDVALDGRGDPTAVWSREDEAQVATGTAGGAFAAPVGLGYPALFPSIAEDAAGDTLVGWWAALQQTATASYRPAGGRFGLPEVVSPPGQKVPPSPVGTELGLNVAIDAQGDGLFGYHSESGVDLADESLLDAAGPQLRGLAIPASATAGTPATFAVGPLDQLSGVSSTTWSFGDGASASGPTVTHTFASPGTYTVSVSATDAVGNSATQSATIAVLAPPAPPAAAPFKPASLGSASVTADSHGHVSLKVSCPAGGAPCTGTVALTLPATASGLAVAARASGVAVTVAAGHASFAVAAGQTRTVGITLPAVVAKLLARRHSLKLTATVQSGGASGPSATKTFALTVKTPKKRTRRKSKRR